MRRAVLAGLLLIVCVSVARAAELSTILDDCIQRLGGANDVGYQRIAARCPDLPPALAASPLASRLPPDWRQDGNELSAGGLQELRTLLERQAQLPPARTRAPDTARLAPLLAKLLPEPEVRGGWWLRFKRWLRNLLAPQATPDQSGWLRWLFGSDGVSEVMQRAILWGSMLLLLALTGAILVNELRIAGLLRSVRFRRGPRSGGQPTASRALTLQELDSVPPLQQVPLLLELIAGRLVAQERLPPARALTIWELARAARLTDEADRGRLQDLGAIAERARYSDREIPADSLTAALARGRQLLAALSLPPHQAQGA